MNRAKEAPANGEAFVTTGRKPRPSEEERARDLAQRYGFAYVSRDGLSIPDLRSGNRGDGPPRPVVVAGGGGLTLYDGDVTFHYHPGMGVNRIRTLRQGGQDWMVRAMGLGEGDHVLDATLGIGSDLLVASYVVGPWGRAVGLESQRLLAILVREGMKSYRHDIAQVTEALRRIDVIWADHQRYLFAEAQEKSFDVVYFDPLFVDPVQESKHMIPLRSLGNKAPLSRPSLVRAQQVARRCVVVKDRTGGPYAASGWFDRVVGGPRSRICYCILDS